MTELSTSNKRKRSQKDKEITDEDLKLKKEKLNLGARSDCYGICIVVDINLVTSILVQASMASDILRCHYGTLSQCLKYPVRVAQLLCEEGVITQTTLFNVKTIVQSHSEKEAIFLLLRAVRHAVHTNYCHLMIFASVLLKFTSNVPCANAIIEDCGKYIIMYL